MVIEHGDLVDRLIHGLTVDEQSGDLVPMNALLSLQLCLPDLFPKVISLLDDRQTRIKRYKYCTQELVLIDGNVVDTGQWYCSCNLYHTMVRRAESREVRSCEVGDTRYGMRLGNRHQFGAGKDLPTCEHLVSLYMIECLAGIQLMPVECSLDQWIEVNCIHV